jgi:tetratricopeptide (TPR) repeat protein
MAKKTKPQDDTLLDVGEAYTKTEKFVDENRSSLTYGIGGVAVLIVAVLAYQSFIAAPAEAQAEETSWRAESYFEMDSVDLAAYGDGFAAGLEEVMNDQSGTAAASRAAYRMGIVHRDAGAFEEAIAAFEQAEASDDVIAVLAVGNIGDCQVELENYAAAKSAFESAISGSEAGMAEAILAPMFLYKAALVEIELNSNSTAKSYLDRIVNDYPKSQQKSGAEAMAASLAGS